MAEATEILKVREAAALLGIHPNSLRALARAARVPATKVGRDWRFIEADLVGWIRSRYPDPARMQPSADRK